MTTQIQKHTFHVVGMHCKACVMLTEDKLGSHPDVHSVRADLETCMVEITGPFGDRERSHIREELTELLTPHGYSLSLERVAGASKWSEFKIAVPIALAILLSFFLLQKAGIVNLVNASSVSYGTAFLIGVVASLSTCMAVVGGLLLSMSATLAREGEKIRPQLMFHAGRLVAFFLLGGLIGLVGTAFALSTLATLILGLLIGGIMLLLGINLLGLFSWSKKFSLGMPRFISKHALGISKLNHSITPLLVGVATFFLPCGFTQAMQIYTLSTGGFLEGGLTMLVFALGTLPVLALVGFSSLSIRGGTKSGIFFKTAGLVVIMFAIFNIINSLAVVGVVPPLFNI